MIYAATPTPIAKPLTLAVAKRSANTAVQHTLQLAGGKGTANVFKCVKTKRQYAVCGFTMRFKSTTSGTVYKCVGTVLLRDIGKGVEKSYGPVYCNGRLVNG